jgi:predicted transcriptional regulator YdeE
MNFEIILLPMMTIMGVELRTTYLNNECYSARPAFWQRVYHENMLAHIPSKTNSDVVLGIYTNYTADFSLTSGYYSLIIGCPVSKVDMVPTGMIVKEIPSSQYAVFISHGAANVPATWAEIWQDKKLDRTFTNDFEWYDAKDPELVKTYVAIKS